MGHAKKKDAPNGAPFCLFYYLNRPGRTSLGPPCLVTVVFGFVWAGSTYANVSCLLVTQHGQLRTEFFEVHTCDLLVEMLWQHVDFVLVFVTLE